MDPLSHAVLGASLAQAALDYRRLIAAVLVAAAAAVAPDLDALVRSSNDPLLYLEYHRSFTHALCFVPFGALLCAAVCWPFVRLRLTPLHTYVLSVLGYTSHLLLDACTTYGTQLLWPFSTRRIAWNMIAFIDPLFAVPLIALTVAAYLRRRPRYARFAVIWVLVYLTLGAVQNERAAAVSAALAASRSHVPVRVFVTPALLSMLLWKTVYEYDGRYYVDAVRAGFAAVPVPGESISRLDAVRDFPWLSMSSQQALDVQRFRRIADDWVAVDANAPDRVIDLRYSLVPNEIAGFWAIVLDPDAAPEDHVKYVSTLEGAPQRVIRLLGMLFATQDEPRNKAAAPAGKARGAG